MKKEKSQIDKEMTIEEALSILIKHTECLPVGMFPAEIIQAASILRQIGNPVERSETGLHLCRCVNPNCRAIYEFKTAKKNKNRCPGCGEHFIQNYDCVYGVKRWTETPVLKRVIKKSDPTYEPVESEE